MFATAPKLNPRLPSPTSIDGVKPSYVEWLEELLMYLSVTDYQEFVPILQAVTGHKDVITKKVFIEGVLSESEDQINRKELEKEALQSGVDGPVDQDQVDIIRGEIDAPYDKKPQDNQHS